MREIFSNNFVTLVIYLAIFVIVVNLVVLVFRNYIKALFQKGKIAFDEQIMREVMKPIYGLSLLLIGYFVIIQISFFDSYTGVVDRVMVSLATLFIASFLAKFVAVFVNYYIRIKKKTKQPPRLITGTISALIYVLAGLIILTYWGVQITPLLAALGVGGIALGLGLQETLSNLFAGLHIVSDEPIRCGDYIEIGTDISGTVEDIGWRSTRLKTLQNNVIIIPNSTLAKSNIVNIAAESQEVSVLIPCGVSYGSDLDKVEAVLLDEMKKYRKKNDYIAPNSEPLVRFGDFGESNINLNVIVRANKYTDRFVIKHELIKAIKSRLDKEKIEISFPVRKIVK